MLFIVLFKSERAPLTSFRRRSRPLGQAYAPSEVSGILFFCSIQVKGMTTFFLISKVHSVCVKIINMISQKSHSLKLFLWKNIFVIGAGFCAVFLGFSINTNEASALFTPTLSASVDQANLQVNGNQVINSTNKSTEIPLNLTVNTNNKTGYTATLNSETDETALVNTDSTTNAKINSISSAELLGDFSNNTWGYKFGASSNYAPIPALSTPAQILQTTGKTNGNDTNSIKIGMKLSDDLESGRYTNKLIFSILTNNYNQIAIMTEGTDFNAKLKALETATNKIEHFKKSAVVPATSMNAVNIEDEESDCEIKLWLDPTDKTAYYYAETEKVYLNTYSGQMFYSKANEQKIKNILEIDISNFDTSNVTNMEAMFTGMSNLTTLNLSNFDTSKVTSMDAMFGDMSSLIRLDLSNFNTSNVTNMDTMFGGMTNLTSLSISNFDTSKVTNMYCMFNGISNLTTLDLSSFDTSKVTTMNAMFGYASSLTTLDISNFNTSKVKDMSYMFQEMSSLTTLNLSNFNTSNVTNMEYMFSFMPALTTLDISNFDTSKVTTMDSMFYDMPALTTLDISNFDTSLVTDMSGMFGLNSNVNDKLEKIYVNNDFNTSSLTNFSEIFKNRKKLRGGNGSYLNNPSTADKSWLRVDRPGVQGYFTRKP